MSKTANQPGPAGEIQDQRTPTALNAGKGNGESSLQTESRASAHLLRRANHPLVPSKELVRAYAKADEAHRAKLAKISTEAAVSAADLPDALSLTMLIKLVLSLLLAAGFVWLVATAIAAIPPL